MRVRPLMSAPVPCSHAAGGTRCPEFESRRPDHRKSWKQDSCVAKQATSFSRWPPRGPRTLGNVLRILGIPIAPDARHLIATLIADVSPDALSAAAMIAKVVDRELRAHRATQAALSFARVKPAALVFKTATGSRRTARTRYGPSGGPEMPRDSTRGAPSASACTIFGTRAQGSCSPPGCRCRRSPRCSGTRTRASRPTCTPASSRQAGRSSPPT